MRRPQTPVCFLPRVGFKLITLLRGQDSNLQPQGSLRFLFIEEICISHLFPNGMDYPIIFLPKKDVPIIVSEPSLICIRAWLPIAEGYITLTVFQQFREFSTRCRHPAPQFYLWASRAAIAPPRVAIIGDNLFDSKFFMSTCPKR